MRLATVVYPVIFAVLSLLLGACQHAPAKQHHLLNAPTPSEWQSSSTIHQTLGIGPVRLAEFLNRPQVAVQSTDGKILMSPNQIWAEPLDQGVARVLALQLTGHSAQLASTPFPWRQDNTPDLSLRLDLQSLVYDGRQLTLSGTWELRQHPGKLKLHHQHFQASQPCRADAADISRALSRLLEQWALAISPQLSGS